MIRTVRRNRKNARVHVLVPGSHTGPLTEPVPALCGQRIYEYATATVKDASTVTCLPCLHLVRRRMSRRAPWTIYSRVGKCYAPNRRNAK